MSHFDYFIIILYGIDMNCLLAWILINHFRLKKVMRLLKEKGEK